MRWSPRLVRLVAALGIASTAALAAYGLTHWRLLEGTLGQLELMTLDYRQRAAADPPRTDSDIVLVLFDSAAVAEWPYLAPFPRAALADLIDAVAAGQPRAIGLDVFLDRRYPVLEAMDGGEARLRDAIRRAGNVVLVAATEQRGDRRVLHRPHPYFAEQAAGIGVADLPTPFETVRGTVLSVRTDQGRVPGLSLALYARAEGIEAAQLLRRAEQEGVLPVPGLPREHARVPERPVHSAPIRFVGPPSRLGHEDGSFVTVPARFAAMVPHLFRDRVVLLGSAIHEQDRFRTPFYSHLDADGEMYGWTQGVEVHAAALHNLLSGGFGRPLPAAAVLALLFALALLAAGATLRTGVVTGAALTVGAGLALAAGSVLAYAEGAWHVPVVGSMLSLGLAYVGASGYHSLVEGRQRRFIRRAFARYVPPAVVDEVAGDPDRLRLGGSRRRVSILFSDLAGFTSLSERTPPEELLRDLNRHLDAMAQVVIDGGGTLDKFIGDAVMAFFGAPVAYDAHAERACRAALAMQRRLRELNAERGGAPLGMRIGINTGEPVVGNIGGEHRFDYTAVGAAVNLAARLEPAAKTYGVGILVSEHTVAEAGEGIRVRELDLITVYGSDRPLRLFQLLDPEDLPPGELLEHYEHGLAAFRQRDWELALRYFEAAAELDPDDGPTRLYRERCTQFLESPPPADWDFVQRRSTK